MNEKEFAPLTPTCVRLLNDKLYEKRKVAALEIEKMVREYVATGNTAQIQRLLRILGQDFTLSQNSNSRKGGLLGLAAIAVALGRDSHVYTESLIKPVLSCFNDLDSRIRYYSCESLFNIIKVSRNSILIYFNIIFDGLSVLAADPDQNVRSGLELLDRLMKDIVTDSDSFDLESFIPLIRERIYTKNSFAKQFIVNWITTLEAVPHLNLLVYLPEFLDGFFHILTDSNPEIRRMCECGLQKFLSSILKSPKSDTDFASMVNILLVHSQSSDPNSKLVAITWLYEFVELAKRDLLPFLSGILASILPCFAYLKQQKELYETSEKFNHKLMFLVEPADDILLELQEKVYPDADELIKQCPPVESLDVKAIVDVLMLKMLDSSMQTRVAVLRWILHLQINIPNSMFRYVNEIFPLLLKTISDESDEVVLLDLDILSEISSSPAGLHILPKSFEPQISTEEITLGLQSERTINAYFAKFMFDFLNLLSTDQQLLDDRASFIIRQLCLLLEPEVIYRCSAHLLLSDHWDPSFSWQFIHTLSSILLTSTELFELRGYLKCFNSESCHSLFVVLYKAWAHNPVDTVALCLLTQNYEHASLLVSHFADLEVTVEFLTDIDLLIQLLESPIFTFLRLQLLEPQENAHLVKTLYGLLMVLPQSDAFNMLRRRLECVPKLELNVASHRLRRGTEQSIDFAALEKHFLLIQDKHRTSRRKPRSLES